MHSYKVTATQQEMVMRFAEALPPKWSQFIDLLKNTGLLDTLSIYESFRSLKTRMKKKFERQKEFQFPKIPRYTLEVLGPE
ncbi:hypothetical protein Hanom_Chr01g00020151 [Helianthus anomalus]